MPQGKIKKVVSDRGFGFIETDRGTDLFFHHSEVKEGSFDHLQTGDRVDYTEGTRKKGPSGGIGTSAGSTWRSGTRAAPPFSPLDGRECYAGLDLSSTIDISALALVFPGEERYDVLCFFWVPEEGAGQRERRDHVPYTQWIRQKHIDATPGEVIDYDVKGKESNLT